MDQAEALTQYKKYVKDNPSEKEGARRSFYDTFQVDPEGFSQPKAETPKRSVSQQAKQNILGMQQREAQGESKSAGEYEKHLKNALWMTKKAATIAPFVLAAPFTGGTSLPVGAAIMGGAGLASGITQETFDATEGERKSWKQVAGNLTWDTLLGGATEVGLRPIAAIGGEFLNAQLLRSAQKSQAGKALVENLETQAHQAIEGVVKARGAVGDVRGIYSTFIQKLAQIPKAGGPTGEMLTAGPQGQIGKFAAMVEKELATVDASGISSVTQKPLDALITMHSKLNEIMHSAAAQEVAGPVRKAGRELAAGMKNLIESNMTAEEKSLFEGAKEITKQKLGLYAGQNLASQVVKRMVGGTVGAAVGFATGSLKTGIEVAAVTEALETKFAPMLLQHLATAEKLPFQRAINAAIGNPEQSASILKNAAVGLAKSLPTEFAETIRSHAKQAVADEKKKADSVVNRASGDKTP